MLLVKEGRITTFANESLHNQVKIIVGIQDKTHVLIQTPTTMEREIVSIRKLSLCDLEIPITSEMSSKEVQEILDAEGVIKKYKEGENYRVWEEKNAYREANDFERFKFDLKKRIQNDLLREKNLL